jgi:hypothetical protein
LNPGPTRFLIDCPRKNFAICRSSLKGSQRPQKRHYQLPPAFSAGLNSHPRRPLEFRVREAAIDYAKRRGQYVRCQLTNGRVVVGTVDGTDGEAFSLRAQKFVPGAAIAGMVVVVVILLPILIPILSLASGSWIDGLLRWLENGRKPHSGVILQTSVSGISRIRMQS